jgi:type I restriction enzyme M protein
VLFRQEEREMRRKRIESDQLDGVLGLGPDLFFNSPMEACVFKPGHQRRIADAYHAFTDQPGFARVAELEQIAANGHSLSIPLYVKRHARGAEADKPEHKRSLREVWDDWEQDGRGFWQQMVALVETLDGLIADRPD